MFKGAEVLKSAVPHVNINMLLNAFPSPGRGCRYSSACLQDTINGSKTLQMCVGLSGRTESLEAGGGVRGEGVSVCVPGHRLTPANK